MLKRCSDCKKLIYLCFIKQQQIMKTTKFKFIPTNTSYEIYNVTDNMIHAVKLNAKGQKCLPNAKTLMALSVNTFDFGVKTQGIVII